ncbi:SDR family oxidoreductase [Streptomyces sp. NBC_00963]|uniref:SDR family oxidoreductase n=1 Tax=Streptomyces sp. NBC_00963 TaxID=2903697 RepID=UPI00386A54D3
MSSLVSGVCEEWERGGGSAAEPTATRLAAARAGMVPTGHRGTSRDVADAALFLASDESAFITGVILPDDGGFTLRAGTH